MKKADVVAWYMAVLAHEFGWSLNPVMQVNLDKLASRRDRGVIHGSGDSR